MQVPRFGLGCAPLGNLFRPRTDEECQATLEAAWAGGVRHFDTAPHYGLGLSEERIGRFLATRPREDFVISTKVGRLVRDNPGWGGSALDDQGFAVPASAHRLLDYSADGVRRSLEESLRRLGLDRVDILYVHDPELSGDARAVETAMAGLAELREEGLVGAIGTGSLSVAALAATVETGLADLVMVANRYTLLDQSVADGLLEACDRYGTRIVAAAVFASGLLATRPRADAKYNYDDVPPDVLERAQRIDEVCSAHGVEIATAALHYPLLDARVTAVVAGAGRPEQVEQNLARLAETVPTALWDDLAELDLVPTCA